MEQLILRQQIDLFDGLRRIELQIRMFKNV